MKPVDDSSREDSFFAILAIAVQFRWILLVSTVIGVGCAVYVHIYSKQNPGRIDWEYTVENRPADGKETAVAATMFLEFFANQIFLERFYGAIVKDFDPAYSVPDLVRTSLAKEIGLVAARAVSPGKTTLVIRWPRAVAENLKEGSVAAAINVAFRQMSMESRQPFLDLSQKWLDLELRVAGLYQKASRKFPGQNAIVDSSMASDKAGMMRRPAFGGLLSLISLLPEGDVDKAVLYREYADILIQQESLQLAKERLRSQFGLLSMLDFSPVMLAEMPKKLGPFNEGIRMIPSLLILLGAFFGISFGFLCAAVIHYLRVNRDALIRTLHPQKG